MSLTACSRRFAFSLALLAALSLPVLAQTPVTPKATSPEQAVDRGLAFLLAHQSPDGAFRIADPNTPIDIGISALALKALASSPRAETDRPALDKAVAFLLANQQPDGGIRGEMIGTYTTSVAVVALQALNNPKLKPNIDRAVAYLRNQQCNAANGYDPRKDPSFGGFGYGGSKGRSDLSNTQMVMDALEAAGIKKDDPAYRDALVFISRCQNNSETNDQPFASADGGGVYTPLGSRDTEYTKPDGTKGFRSYGSMTYALLKSMIYADLSKSDPRVVAAFGWISSNYTLDENPGMGKSGLYYYYHTFASALAAAGDDSITDAKGVKHDWRKELAARLIDLQRPDGSWFNDQRDRWNEDNPVLVTSYSVLALQESMRKGKTK